MKLVLFKDKDDLALRLNSWIIALLFCSNVILSSLNFMLPNQNGVINNALILAVCAALLTVRLLVKPRLFVPKAALAVGVYVTLWFLLTLLLHYNESTINTMQIIFYALLPIFAVSQRFDIEMSLRFSIYLSLISIPVLPRFFVLLDNIHQTAMGNIYPLLTPIILCIIHFALYRKRINFVIVAAYIYNIYVLLQIFLVANRGAIFCLLITVALLALNRFSGDEIVKLTPLRIIVIIAILIFAGFAIINALPILEWLSMLCRSVFHTVPSFISKMIFYIKAGDFTDGRVFLYTFTVDSISQHPLLGYGIKTFLYHATEYGRGDWPYPHNYILQFLYEGGILFGAAPIYLSLSLSVKTIAMRIRSKKEFALCATLFCLTVPKLLISTDLWMSTTLWMLITYSLMHIAAAYRAKASARAAKTAGELQGTR